MKLERTKLERMKLEGVKSERTSVKRELGSMSAAVKAEAKFKKEEEIEHKLFGAKLEAKVERARTSAVKAELDNQVASLLQRGMSLRAEAAAQKSKNEVASARVKREKKGGKATRKTRAAGGTRRRCSAARRNASREVINRAVPLSPELAGVLGASALSRPEAVKRLWAHCKEEGLLNPEDKREILFNSRLSQVFGRPSARLTDLMSILVPHFDFASQATKGEPASKAEPASASVKLQRGAKVEAARGAKVELKGVKRPLQSSCKEERGLFGGGSAAKASSLFAAARMKAEAARSSGEAGAGGPFMKAETAAVAAVPRPTLAKADLDALAAGLILRLVRVGRSDAAVECELSEALAGDVVLDAVARPVAGPGNGAGASEPRARCSVEFCEAADGALRPRVSAELQGLDPELGYRLAFEVSQPSPSSSSSSTAPPPAGPAAAAAASALGVSGATGAGGAAQAASGGGASAGSARSAVVAGSPEVSLPQRARPEKWTPQEALLWIAALQVPELAQKAREYAIDGQTLLALGDEDLQALGLSAPFLRRRVLAGIQTLRSGGVGS